MVEKGPIRVDIQDDDYPHDDIGRHFANPYYTRLMDNGEKRKQRMARIFKNHGQGIFLLL